jgi:hypothetical protein
MMKLSQVKTKITAEIVQLPPSHKKKADTAVSIVRAWYSWLWDPFYFKFFAFIL